MMASNYTTAWLIYLAAIPVAHGLLWAALRRMRSRETRQVIHLCVFAFLITPARLEPGSPLWVPAFMAALMEGIDRGMDAASERLWPIFALMLALIVVSMLWRVLRARRAQRRAATAD